MKKDLTELVFILDRSGSMGGLEADTIGGFNSLHAGRFLWIAIGFVVTRLVLLSFIKNKRRIK